MSDYASKLGRVVRKARNDKRLTQKQLAEQMDVDTRTVAAIEGEHGNPKLEVLYPLIRTLRLDPNEIFYSETAEPAEPASIMEDFQRFLAGCHEEELQFLLPVCEVIIKTYRW